MRPRLAPSFLVVVFYTSDAGCRDPAAMLRHSQSQSSGLKAVRHPDDSPARSHRPEGLKAAEVQEPAEELRARLDYMAEMGKLVEPLRMENVRLVRSLKQIRSMLQELVEKVRKFFSSKDRREWFQNLKDSELLSFFQQLIEWYRRVDENDKDPMLIFYRKLWEYERGDGEKEEAHDIKMDMSSRSSNPRSTTSFMSSEKLYDACHARMENTLLVEENRRLREENLDLRQKAELGAGIASGHHSSGQVAMPCGSQAAGDLWRTIGSVGAAEAIRPAPPSPDPSGSAGSWLQTSQASVPVSPGAEQLPLPDLLASRPGSRAASQPGSSSWAAIAPSTQLQLMQRPASTKRLSEARSPVNSERTLSQLAAIDPRWQRLLNDPSELFNGTDVIDDTYGEYLADVLEQMEKHGCCFKDGVNLSAGVEAAPVPQQNMAPTFRSVSGAFLRS